MMKNSPGQLGSGLQKNPKTMETIKIKVAIPVTQKFEVEITLPVYRKSGDIRCHFWKVYSAKECLHAYIGGSIEIQSSQCAFQVDDVDCTKEEFDAAYSETLAILNSKL
jgi:hypothetical protein